MKWEQIKTAPKGFTDENGYHVKEDILILVNGHAYQAHWSPKCGDFIDEGWRSLQGYFMTDTPKAWCHLPESM